MHYIISPQDILCRRFPIDNPFFWKWVGDRKVPTSAAFKTKPGEDGLSVEIAHLTTADISIQDPLKFNLALLQASVPMEIGLVCIHNPLPNNNAHALIVGENTKSIAKKLSLGVKEIISF